MKFPVETVARGDRPRGRRRPVSLVIWTTTPWTLPANLAIAVHPSETYTAVELDGRGPRRRPAAARGLPAPARREGARRRAAARGAGDRRSRGSSRPAPVDRPRRAGARRATSSRWTRAPAWSTSRPGHGEEDYELGRRARAARSTTRWTTTGASSPRSRTSPGSDRLGGEPADHRAPARSAARSWPRCRSSTPTRTAGAARTRRSSAPPSSGSSRSTSARAAPAGARRDRNEVDVDPGRGARSASTTWSRTGPTGAISRQRVWGVPDRRLLLRELRARCSSTSALVEHVAGHHARRRRAPTSGTRATAAELLPAGHARARSAAAGSSARRPTSSTCGSTPAAATPRCSRRGRSCAGRPRCTSRARTSTAAGSTPRCSRRWARASAPPYRAVLTHGFVVDGEGRKMSKSLGQQRRARRAHPEVRRRGPAPVGGGRGLHRGHPALRRDPGPARRGLPADPQHLPLPPREPRRLRPASATGARTAQLDELDRWALLRLRRADRAGAAGVRGVPVPRRLPRLHNFCAVDLSALYLDVLKDRLYTSAPDDPRRRAAQTVCFEILTALDAADGADPDLHGRRGLGAHPGARQAGERAPRRPSPRSAASGSTSASSADGSGCSRCAARSRARSRPRAQQGTDRQGLDAVLYVPSAPEEQWLPLLEAKGEALLADALHRLAATRLEQRAAGGRGAATRARTSPASPRGRARADPRLEEVRALLDLEPARRRGPRAPDALRALPAGRDARSSA